MAEFKPMNPTELVMHFLATDAEFKADAVKVVRTTLLAKLMIMGLIDVVRAHGFHIEVGKVKWVYVIDEIEKMIDEEVNV